MNDTMTQKVCPLKEGKIIIDKLAVPREQFQFAKNTTHSWNYVHFPENRAVGLLFWPGS